jgi:MerR family transcriptional regulator, light-induced transcriptional regulator
MYTIKQAAARSGSSVLTVRVWERRYGVVRPERTPAGYRLYDDAAIDRLIAMRELVDQQGFRPSQAAAGILGGEVDVGAVVRESRNRQVSPEPSVATGSPSRAAVQADAFVSAAIRLDLATMDRVLDDAFAAERFEAAMEHVIFPALRTIGMGWSDGSVDVSMEHAASELVRRRLARFYEAEESDGRPEVIVGMPPGGRHEIGALAFAVAARRRGIQVLYLGSDVPVASWVVALEASRARVVVIGVVALGDMGSVAQVIDALGTVGRPVTVALGGMRSEAVGASSTTVILPNAIDPAVAVLRELVRPAAPAALDSDWRGSHPDGVARQWADQVRAGDIAMSTNDPLGGIGDLLGGLTGSGSPGTSGLPAGLGDAIGGLLGGNPGSGGADGLDTLIKGFEQAGLGDQVSSWIGSGPNRPVSADEIGKALGPVKVQELSKSTGLDVGRLLPMLAALLPQIIDALTPNGHVPATGEASGNPMDAIGGLLKGLGG